jgi:hypothetical protein
MACLVEVFVVSTLDFAVRSGWNDSGFSGLCQDLENPLVSMVALVGDHDRSIHSRQQPIGPFQITGLSRRQQESGRVAQGIDGSMNLGAQPAFAAPNGLVGTVFFGAPARC